MFHLHVRNQSESTSVCTPYIVKSYTQGKVGTYSKDEWSLVNPLNGHQCTPNDCNSIFEESIQ